MRAVYPQYALSDMRCGYPREGLAYQGRPGLGARRP